MGHLTPQIFEFAARFRAELEPRDRLEEILVDGVIAAAVRLKRLYAEPAAFDPHDADDWDRAHDRASAAFFRHYDRLERRRRAAAKPAARPLPASFHNADRDRPTTAPIINRLPREAPAASVEGPVADDPPVMSDHPQTTAASSTTSPDPVAARPDAKPRRPDPKKAQRRERERRKQERREQRREARPTVLLRAPAHPLPTPIPRASPAA